MSLDADGMMTEARDLASISENVVVKVPMTTEGLKAASRCRSEGIKTNVTLVFSPLQALLAAKAGATYISPFVGRLDDISHTGMELIGQLVQIFNNYEFETEILVASVRHPLHVVEAAMMGADVATIPFSVDVTRKSLTPISSKRVIDVAASFVCKVDRTLCPVSAAWPAISAVS